MYLDAIEYLKQIKNMDSIIQSDIEELATLEALATKTTAVMGDDRVQSSGSQQKMADCVVKIADMRKQISEEIDTLLKLKQEARSLICSVRDADCITLLFKRYLMYKTWEQIAVEMNFTYQWVSDGLHKRALGQVQKILDEKG